MPKTLSKDGTTIAYDKFGSGPAVIIINGALGHRDYYGDKELAKELSKEFTVIIYDRRGRGESTDTLPYSVEREIDDIEALVEVAGGKASLYGVSSGAVLALKATAKLGNKVTKLAIYEPPWNMDVSKEEFSREFHRLKEVLAAGKRGDAVALFMGNFMTPEMIEDFQRTKADEWKIMERVAPTLAYDYAILGEGMTPVETAKFVDIPTLVMNGSEGLPFIHDALQKITQALPNGQRITLQGQTHEASAQTMAPVLTEFFKRR
jgi:pimeloyl-ACP methyl ester carboxylesterase